MEGPCACAIMGHFYATIFDQWTYDGEACGDYTEDFFFTLIKNLSLCKAYL